MMKPFHIRSFHASHRLNLVVDEREYLPWMSDLSVGIWVVGLMRCGWWLTWIGALRCERLSVEA
jgi:hypothetical protein